MIYTRLREVPILVRTLCFIFGGWVVGGSAKYLTDESVDLTRDWDVVVPPEKWSEVVMILPPGTVTNTFGGFKVLQNEVEIDFWPEDFGHYFSTVDSRFGETIGVHLRTQRVAKLEFPQKKDPK